MPARVPRVPAICQSCGGIKMMRQKQIDAGEGRFCSNSCANRVNSTKHGYGGSLNGSTKPLPEYATWSSMKGRCDNPNDRRYSRYGGRGIKYDPSWSEFPQFYADMGPRPDPKMSLDRIDNDKGYSKENCRWTDSFTQASNTSRNRFVEYQGQRFHISALARYLGLSTDTISRRINKGWPEEEWASKPDSKRYRIPRASTIRKREAQNQGQDQK